MIERFVFFCFVVQKMCRQRRGAYHTWHAFATRLGVQPAWETMVFTRREHRRCFLLCFGCILLFLPSGTHELISDKLVGCHQTGTGTVQRRKVLLEREIARYEAARAFSSVIRFPAAVGRRGSLAVPSSSPCTTFAETFVFRVAIEAHTLEHHQNPQPCTVE